jgi:hypothetical protein
METGGPFPGAKARPGRDADHSPHLVPRLRMSRSCTSTPSSAFVACSGTAFKPEIYNSEYLGRDGMIILKLINMTVFWVVVSCNLVEIYQLLEVLIASIIRTPDDGGNKHRCNVCKLLQH